MFYSLIQSLFLVHLRINTELNYIQIFCVLFYLVAITLICYAYHRIPSKLKLILRQVHLVYSIISLRSRAKSLATSLSLCPPASTLVVHAT